MKFLVSKNQNIRKPVMMKGLAQSSTQDPSTETANNISGPVKTITKRHLSGSIKNQTFLATIMIQ